MKYENRLQSSWPHLVLRVGSLWRCGDGLFFEVPPSVNDAFLTTLHPLLENVMQTVDHFKISCLGAPFSRLEKPNELNSVFGLEKVDRWNHIRTSAIQSRSRSMRFLGSSNHEKRAPRQVISKWSTVCSTFSRSGWSVVRSALLAKGVTSKKRPSPRLHKVPTRSNVSRLTFQTSHVLSLIRINQCLYNFYIFEQIIRGTGCDVQECKICLSKVIKKSNSDYGAGDILAEI
jgi:hypothetical protein